VSWYINSTQRDTTVTLATMTRGAKEPQPVTFDSLSTASAVAQALVETTGIDWYPSPHVTGEPMRAAFANTVEVGRNLPDAAKHLADLIGQLNDAINKIEGDPQLAKVAQDLGAAWQDVLGIARDLR